MRTLIANELDLVHGGANDGRWHWVDIGHNGQALGVMPPLTLGYRTNNILLGNYGWQAIVSHNVLTGGNTVSFTATDGGPQYNFFVGTDGSGGSFTDNFNGGNSMSFFIDLTPGGDIEMLQLQFVHKIGVEPKAIGAGGALADTQPLMH